MRPLSLDDLLHIRGQEFCDDQVERDIVQLMKTLETDKNLFLFFPYNIYFDENDNVVACINQDTADSIRQQRVVALMIAMGGCVAGLVIFAIIARATFGKPWYRWVASIRG